jgi:hypothetical protein
MRLWRLFRIWLLKKYIQLVGIRFFYINGANLNKRTDVFEIVAENDRKAVFSVYDYALTDTVYYIYHFESESKDSLLIEIIVDPELSDKIYKFNGQKLLVKLDTWFLRKNKIYLTPILVELYIGYIKTHYDFHTDKIHCNEEKNIDT